MWTISIKNCFWININNNNMNSSEHVLWCDHRYMIRPHEKKCHVMNVLGTSIVRIRIKMQVTKGVNYHTPVACWNDIWHIRLTCSWAPLACSFYAKAQLRRPDITHQNQTQVNTYRLLLSSSDQFHVQIKVNSLAFTIQNSVIPDWISFTTCHRCCLASASISLQQQRQKTELKRKANPVYEKEKRNGKWQDSRKQAASD